MIILLSVSAKLHLKLKKYIFQRRTIATGVAVAGVLAGYPIGYAPGHPRESGTRLSVFLVYTRFMVKDAEKEPETKGILYTEYYSRIWLR